MNFEQVKQQEQANMMHTYGRFPVALVKGKGVTAWDTEGKDYIDFTSGIGVNALGWCDEGCPYHKPLPLTFLLNLLVMVTSAKLTTQLNKPTAAL